MTIAATRTHDGRGNRSPFLTPVVASLPLLVVSVALFVAGYLCFWLGVRVGPGAFSLWALLLVLGFIAAIGATISWFFAEEELALASVPAVAGGSDALPAPRAVPPVTTETQPWFEGPPAEVTVSAPVFRATARADAEMGQALKEIELIQREVASRRKREVVSPR
jgi:hypothetical protein